jgi:carboxyl-terminal processing protease
MKHIPTKGILAAILLVLMGASAAGGYWIGRTNPEKSPAAWQPLQEAWDVVHKEYVDQPVDDPKLIEGAIAGMVYSLGDEHSGYMPPDQYQQSISFIEGSYIGIGVEVDTSGEYLRIVAPFRGSPAANVGLQPDDAIVRIDGEDMTGIDPVIARQKVLGPEGSRVHLSIRRNGSPDLLEFNLPRVKITAPSLESKMLPGSIAYVHLFVFGDNSGTDLHSALRDLMAQHPKALILDLRSNPGGLVDTAVAVASEFLPKGRIVTVVKMGDGSQQEYKTKGNGLATDIPMVVLVNKGSASASEMVSGALQDDGRAQLVGTTTYGKGSMQDWHPLSNGKAGAVRITIARFFTPNGRPIANVGLKPDVVVEYTEDDFHAGKDPQLDAAVNLLEK